ncbi:MAG: LysR family transcriptional regulator [Sphingomonas sp.]
MSMPELPWNHYRTFLAVIQEGSLSGAARRIGITQPTAGRHIEALERVIGARLFNRLPTGLSPTEPARRLLPHAEAMAVAASAIQRSASADAEDERGIVRLSAPELIGQEVLPSVLQPFCARFSGVIVELKLSNRNENVLRGDVDIAIRMARPAQEALIARRLGDVKLGLYAHRKYIGEFGTPDLPTDLRNHRLIGFDEDQQLLRAGDSGEPPPDRSMFGFRCDSGSMHAAAVRAGIGIGALHVNYAGNDADLVRVLEPSFTMTREMWLVMHEAARSTRRIRLLFDHLNESLSAFVRTRRAPR